MMRPSFPRRILTGQFSRLLRCVGLANAKFKSRRRRPWDESNHGLPVLQKLEDRLMLTATLDLDTMDTYTPIFEEDSTDAINVTSQNVDIGLPATESEAQVFFDDFSGTLVEGSDPGQVGGPPDLTAAWRELRNPVGVVDDGTGNKVMQIGGNARVLLKTVAPLGDAQGNPLYDRAELRFDLTTSGAPTLFMQYVNDSGQLIELDPFTASTSDPIELDEDALHEDFQVLIFTNTGSGTWDLDNFEVVGISGGGSGVVEGATVTLEDYDAAKETVDFAIPATSDIMLLSQQTVGDDLVFVFDGDGTDEQYETLFESFTYRTTEQDPAPVSPKTFTFVVATDDGSSNVATSTIALLPDTNNVDPQVTLDPVAAITEDGVATLTGTITDTEVLDTFELVVDWGDGTSTPTPITFGPSATGMQTFSLTHQYLDDNAADLFTISATVEDDDGGIGTDTTSVVVTNVDPTVAVSLDKNSILENGEVTLTGTVTDVGTLDTFTQVVIDWGDTVETLNFADIATGANTFEVTHQYLDDDPSGTASDTFTIEVSVTDDDGGVGTATTSVSVANVDPDLVVTADDGSFGNVAQGNTYGFTGSFADFGTLDTHTITVDWGDGTVETDADANVTLDQLAGSVSGSHVYAEGGIYDVVITLTDDDGGSADQFTTQVFVTGAGVTGDGTLRIIGDNTKNRVLVKLKNGEYQVRSDFLSGTRTFADAEVDEIEIITGDGNDFVLVSTSVTETATIDAGAGDDVVIGGSGDDVLIGGDGRDFLFGRKGNDVIVADEGNDVLVGGDGDDLMVGGDGSDALIGNKGNDILIGGTTTYTTDELVLLLDQWVAGNTSDVEEAFDLGTTVLDDGDFDLLLGGSGDDLQVDEGWFC